MESWCDSLASTFFAEWAPAHQNNSYCCPLCCCPRPNIIFFLLLVAWICKNNSQSPWHNFLLATTLAQIFYIVRESSFTPYLPFGLAAIFLTSKIPYFLFPKALPNLSMKEGSLFCSYEIQRTRMLQIVFLVSRESSRRGGVHGLGSMTFGHVLQKLLNIE